MRRAVIIFIRAAGLVTALLLVLAGAAAFVMNTDAGTRWVLSRVVAAVPGELALGDYEGTLWRGLRFEQVRYSDPARQVTATGLSFRINWATLPARRLTLQQLDIGALEIESLAPQPETPAPLDLALRPAAVDFSVTDGTLRRLVLGGNREPVVLTDLTVRSLRSDGIAVRAGRIAGTTARVEVIADRPSIRLRGDLPLTATVEWRLEDGSWSGAGSVSGSASALEFDQVVEGPYPGTATGTLELEPGARPDADLRVNWERWSVGAVDVADGEARLRGWLDGFTADYDATLTIAADQRVAVTGTAQGSIDRIDTFSATVTGAPGTADVTGTVQLRPAIAAAVRVDGSAEYRDMPVRVRGSLDAEAGRVQCPDCSLEWAGNTVNARGTWTDGRLDLRFDADVPRIDRLVQGVAAHARASGRVTGSFDDPLVAGNVQVTALRRVDGPMPPVDLRAMLQLRRIPDGARVTVTDALLSEAGTGDWDLAQPFDIRIGAGTVDVGSHGWTGANGAIHIATLRIDPDSVTIEAGITGLPLGLAQAWLPPNIRVLGTAEASANLVFAGGQWAGTVDWQQDGTTLQVTEANGDVTAVVVPEAALRADLEGGGLTARATIGIDPGIRGELDVTLDRLAADANLTAALRLGGDDWSWVSAVVPQVDRFEGAISAAVTANGPLRAPALSGDLTWKHGRLLVPSLNVPLDEIDVVVSGASAGSATMSGSAKAGSGSLAIDGRFQDLMRPSRSAEIHFGGKSAELLNWPEYRIWGTPDLVVTGNADGWQFAGKLGIPRAEIALREIPEEAVAISPDVVVLGEEQETRYAQRVRGEATLTLGDRVHIDALGLDARLTGSLLVRVRPERPITAEGKVSLVDGRFTAYGQKLTITEGELTFTGPLDDPIVNVRAVRVIETIDGTVTAGLHLRGRATNLTTSVYAEPAMAEADALSYLVVGRPLNQATEAEGGDLAGAAVALGLKQAARLTDQIGQAIGLDQLALTGDGGDSTALVAGKQINSRLYARYSYGVFSRLGSLLVRYRMSKRLTLEAGAGENQSIDVLYSVETD